MNSLRVLWFPDEDSDRNLISADYAARVYEEDGWVCLGNGSDDSYYHSPHPLDLVEQIVAIARCDLAGAYRQDKNPFALRLSNREPATQEAPRLVSCIFDISKAEGIEVVELYVDPRAPGKFYERTVPFSIAPLPADLAPRAPLKPRAAHRPA